MPSLFPSLRGRARGEAFNKMNRDTALVVFSGGQDSTTCLFWAKREFKKVYALSFLYGQKHQKEVDLARAIARKAGVEFEVMDVSFIGRLGHNSLTDAGMEMDQEKPDRLYQWTFLQFFLNTVWCRCQITYRHLRQLQNSIHSAIISLMGSPIAMMKPVF